MTTLKLTTIGSRISVDIGPAAIPEAYGGVAVLYRLFDGPLIGAPPLTRLASFYGVTEGTGRRLAASDSRT